MVHVKRNVKKHTHERKCVYLGFEESPTFRDETTVLKYEGRNKAHETY